VFEGGGRVVEYVGGYEDWLRQRGSEPAAPAPKQAKPRKPRQPKPAAAPKPKPAKLSYKDQRELEALPARIEALESEQDGLHAAMADPAFYQQDKAAIAAAKQRAEVLERELSEAYQRWEALEEFQH
jgi:ATP-binding cassette subfamily F protein uup